MLRSLSEWKTFALEKGTSGEMVFDILKDWEEQLDIIQQVNNEVNNKEIICPSNCQGCESGYPDIQGCLSNKK